jgi:(S)-ureidoglycine aminohydrolase
MKFSVFISGLLICIATSLNAQTIVPKVYTWDNAVITNSSNVMITRKIFAGPGAILSLHQMNGITLHAGKSITYKDDPAGYERFIIIKDGTVTVKLNGQPSLLGRGSVVSVLPGDKMVIENTNTKDANFYEMNYHSIEPMNAERGKKAGPSFVINWNDMAIKSTDKGSTRQLFDRQTTMLNRFDIHVTQLNQGFESHPPHTHKNEEIILMLDGNAEMTIGTDHQKANGGDVVFMGSNVSHNLTNIGTTPCLYFAIQWN